MQNLLLEVDDACATAGASSIVETSWCTSLHLLSERSPEDYLALNAQLTAASKGALWQEAQGLLVMAMELRWKVDDYGCSQGIMACKRLANVLLPVLLSSFY